MPRQKITDESADHKYFIITPQLVWAYSRTLYDYTLWNVVKMIAGDDGECYLATEDLATMAMMSAGKISDCRQYLLEAGLLEGELRKDPDYPQPVWHLRIPNLWPKNIEWRESHDSIASRLKWKQEQKESLHQVKPSPGEEGVTPGEEGVTPGEAKNNHTKIENISIAPDGEKTTSPLNGRADSRDPTSLPDIAPADELELWFGQAPVDSDGALYMLQRSGWDELLADAELTQMGAKFLEITNWSVPTSPNERKSWVSAFREQRGEFGASVAVATYPKARDWLREQGMNIASPRSLSKTIRLILRGELDAPRVQEEPKPKWKVTDLRTGEVIS